MLRTGSTFLTLPSLLREVVGVSCLRGVVVPLPVGTPFPIPLSCKPSVRLPGLPVVACALPSPRSGLQLLGLDVQELLRLVSLSDAPCEESLTITA